MQWAKIYGYTDLLESEIQQKVRDNGTCIRQFCKTHRPLINSRDEFQKEISQIFDGEAIFSSKLGERRDAAATMVKLMTEQIRTQETINEELEKLAESKGLLLPPIAQKLPALLAQRKTEKERFKAEYKELSASQDEEIKVIIKQVRQGRAAA